jgi:ribA/ribD-fused uncharacterized protein
MLSAEERLIQDGFEGIEPVLFFGKKGSEHPYYCFSNFAPIGLILPCPFTGERKSYPTGEHRYQAMKANTVEGHEWVRKSSTAYISKQRGREVSLRDCWGERYGDLCYLVMLETVLAKASSSPHVRKVLKETGFRPIYEDSPVDDIWGWRHQNNHNGRNLLGRCWMQVRNLLDKT